MRKCWHGVATVLVLLVACAPFIVAQQSPTVRQRSLAELTEKSATIVHGTVTSAVVENHPTLSHLPTILVKVRVVDTLKGSAAETFTFRQFVWNTRGSQLFMPPEYRPGQELLLLMRAPSRYALSSPAGMEQGVFAVSRDKTGQAYAVNGRNNVKLFSGAKEALGSSQSKLKASAVAAIRTDRPGPVRLEDLKNIIKQLVESSDAK